MNEYTRLSYRLLGPLAERHGARDKELQKRLFHADWAVRAAAYRASLWLTAGFAALVGFVASAPVAGALPGLSTPVRVAVPLAFAFLFAALVFALAPVLLRNAATERAKDLDENLPHGLNYMLALANAGLPPRDIWGSLGRQKVFGALAVEATRIRRDLDLFGRNLIDALRDAQERTPSKRFAEFLQGAISAFQSGVELESYLRTKGDQYQREATEQQLQDIDTMGLMAETFLVVVVAAPLFLVILLTVMSVNQGESVILWGYLLVLVFIPVCQLVIGALVKSLNPRVWT